MERKGLRGRSGSTRSTSIQKHRGGVSSFLADVGLDDRVARSPVEGIDHDLVLSGGSEGRGGYSGEAKGSSELLLGGAGLFGVTVATADLALGAGDLVQGIPGSHDRAKFLLFGVTVDGVLWGGVVVATQFYHDSVDGKSPTTTVDKVRDSSLHGEREDLYY